MSWPARPPRPAQRLHDVHYDACEPLRLSAAPSASASFAAGKRAPTKNPVLASTDTLHAAQACRLWRALCQAAPALPGARAAGARQGLPTRCPPAHPPHAPSPARQGRPRRCAGRARAWPVHPLTTNTSSEKRSSVLNACASQMFRFRSPCAGGRAPSAGRATPHTSRALQLARHIVRSAAGASPRRARRPPPPAEHAGAWRVGPLPRSSYRRNHSQATIAPLRRAPDAAAHCHKAAQRACCRAMETHRLEAAAADPWKLAPRLYIPASGIS